VQPGTAQLTSPQVGDWTIFLPESARKNEMHRQTRRQRRLRRRCVDAGLAASHDAQTRRAANLPGQLPLPV
jgi:hypothetical protein